MYTKESIERVANNLLIELAKVDNSFSNPPYITEENKFKLVELLGGKLEYIDSIEVDGVIIPSENDENENFIIQLPASIERTSHLRDIFTIAHEIGHLFIHMGYGSDEFRNQKNYNDAMMRFGNSEEENEANHFAGNFLMPRDKFENYWKEKNGSLGEMAEAFGVSKPAISTRAKFLGLIRW